MGSTKVVGGSGVPSGSIIMWSGNIASIPSGWYLCNGSNSTPDLRNRFVVCADADDGGVAKSTISGAALQTEESSVKASVLAHTHTAKYQGYNASTAVSGITANGYYADGQTGPASATGTGTDTYPRYYALAFIMKA